MIKNEAIKSLTLLNLESVVVVDSDTVASTVEPTHHAAIWYDGVSGGGWWTTAAPGPTTWPTGGTLVTNGGGSRITVAKFVDLSVYHCVTGPVSSDNFLFHHIFSAETHLATI